MLGADMKESLHDFVLRNLELTKGRWQEVADGSGVPKRTVEKIARQETEDPRVGSVQKLADYFGFRGHASRTLN
jgi:hypothetical protein